MKRYFALILAALLLMPTIVSCSQNGSEETKGAETTADTAAIADSEAETDDETDDGNIRSWEGLTFDGAEINIVGRTEATYAIDFYAEEITGEAVNDAVYNRNAKVDNDLSVQLNYINGSDDYNTFFTNVRNSVSAADGAYDIVSSYAYFAAPLSLEKLFTNLHTVPNLALTNSWYNQSFVNDMTVNGQLDFVIGDLTLTATDRMIITFFNKEQAQRWIPDVNLYEDVYEGKWTVDYLAMRAFGDRDVLLDSDLVVKRELARREITSTAEWAPYRSYATMHLWFGSGVLTQPGQHYVGTRSG